MTRKTTQQLTQKLESVIEKMKKIQLNITADQQPVSMTELNSLTKLGKKYAKIIKQLSKIDASEES